MNYLSALRYAMIGLLLLLPVGAFAQNIDLNNILPNAEVRGKGWTQLTNLGEMMDFAIALVEITVLTIVITYHPVIVSARRDKSDFELARTDFLYALIGMVVGFLVLHHGYVIGFVIFGMGSFMRFRADSTATTTTTRMILITLIGLCIGLDLPVIALIATVGGWLVVYFFSAHEKLQFEVLFNDSANIQESIDSLSALLADRGFETLAATKGKFKPQAQFVVQGARSDQRDILMRELNKIMQAESFGLKDWHLD